MDLAATGRRSGSRRSCADPARRRPQQPVCRHGSEENYRATGAGLEQLSVNLSRMGGGHRMMTARLRFLGLVAVVASRCA